MKINNETKFSTRDLRKVFLAGLKDRGANYKSYRIRVYNSRKGIRGYAWVNSYDMAMGIPSKEDLTNSESMERFAQVFIHEVDHTLGLKHREMKHIRQIDVSWSEGMTIQKESPKPKKTISMQERIDQREQKAKDKTAMYEKKVKHYQNLLKKWKKKVKYYERRNKAASPE